MNKRANTRIKKQPWYKAHTEEVRRDVSEYGIKAALKIIAKEGKTAAREEWDKLSTQQKWWKSPKNKDRRHQYRFRRRQFGYAPLNKYFPGAVGHHVDRVRVIFIPKVLHQFVWHSVTKNINMDRINALAFEFLRTISPEFNTVDSNNKKKTSEMVQNIGVSKGARRAFFDTV